MAEDTNIHRRIDAVIRELSNSKAEAEAEKRLSTRVKELGPDQINPDAADNLLRKMRVTEDNIEDVVETVISTLRKSDPEPFKADLKKPPTLSETL